MVVALGLGAAGRVPTTDTSASSLGSSAAGSAGGPSGSWARAATASRLTNTQTRKLQRLVTCAALRPNGESVDGRGVAVTFAIDVSQRAELRTQKGPQIVGPACAPRIVGADVRSFELGAGDLAVGVGVGVRQ